MKSRLHPLRMALLLVLVLSGLSCRLSIQTAPIQTVAEVAACRDFLIRVDQVVAQAGVKDTSAVSIAGFPCLRSNRFWAYIGPELTSKAQIIQWLQQMHALDLEARRKEIALLAPAQVSALAPAADPENSRQTLLAQTLACSSSLFAHAMGQDDIQHRILSATTVPEEYETWRRIAGFYPLAALPVAWASNAVFDKFRRWHLTPLHDLPVTGTLRTYQPPARSQNAARTAKAMFAPSRRDPLGLPLLTLQDERELALYFAPVITQDDNGAYDHIGPVVWRNDRLMVAPSEPTFYYYLSRTMFQSKPILQINYAFWYSHRMGSEAPWIERGELDGLTVRVSLDPDGEPFMVDIMNNCGCYHFFVPAEARFRALRYTIGELAPLVPSWLPRGFPQARLNLRVSTGWHQVQHIDATPAANGENRPYNLLPYAVLETLPDGHGGWRSMFDQNGIAYNSSRIEPLIFFSMGIPDVGSMRQRGHHAIKLVGRAHFDDPTLFDRTFEFRE